MVVIFPDSNVLLQCEPLNDLPWHEITTEPDVLPLIAREVQREMDRLTGDGNRRRARHARAATSLFRKILDTSPRRLVLKDGPPRVEVALAPTTRVAGAHPDLDVTQADEPSGQARVLLETKTTIRANERIRV